MSAHPFCRTPQSALAYCALVGAAADELRAAIATLDGTMQSLASRASRRLEIDRSDDPAWNVIEHGPAPWSAPMCCRPMGRNGTWAWCRFPAWPGSRFCYGHTRIQEQQASPWKRGGHLRAVFGLEDPVPPSSRCPVPVWEAKLEPRGR